jgi:hypothetical protein
MVKLSIWPKAEPAIRLRGESSPIKKKKVFLSFTLLYIKMFGSTPASLAYNQQPSMWLEHIASNLYFH